MIQKYSGYENVLKGTLRTSYEFEDWYLFKIQSSEIHWFFFRQPLSIPAYVRVLDDNDNAPAFVGAPYSLNVSEARPISVELEDFVLEPGLFLDKFCVTVFLPKYIS